MRIPAATLALVLAAPLAAQNAGPPPGRPAFVNITAPAPTIPEGITVESPKVHGASLEGNLEGNSPDREVMVVLPPSYGKEPNRRYPVVYYLHGFAIDGRNFYNYMNVPKAVADNAAQGNEFIVVVPDTLTRMGGSMYSDSVTTGNFREFVAKDLVAYIDAHYRTIASKDGRGLAGHSMGGYGTWVTAMSYPGVFDSIWAQSACCVTPRGETVESATAMGAVPIDGVDASGFGMRAGLASMTAWSPNPKNPPFYADFPLGADGKVDELVIAKWSANSPLAMVPGHVDALRSYDAIASDVGDKDGLNAQDKALSEEIAAFGIANAFEIYPGTHTDKIGERFSSLVLPYFAKHLQMK
ncbi:esterase [Altererythrobacter salegens]|uniref:Esterase n=1 Tax=Croceibacterium salegens TaxID=1737568 RepID=A0A6I4T2D9_9SPHN|nr:alpha/beta fold hydrolase [Croceibacterium salegens]MXO60822.1 esterase [Croceibacterium salegens]